MTGNSRYENSDNTHSTLCSPISLCVMADELRVISQPPFVEASPVVGGSDVAPDTVAVTKEVVLVAELLGFTTKLSDVVCSKHKYIPHDDQ